MGHIISIEATTNAGLGVITAFITAFMIARSRGTPRVRGAVAPEVQGGSLEQSKTSLRNILPMVATLLPAREQRTPSAGSACACASEAPHTLPFTELEEKSKNMAPIGELLSCIGTRFVADEEQELNPTQAIEEFDKGAMTGIHLLNCPENGAGDSNDDTHPQAV